VGGVGGVSAAERAASTASEHRFAIVVLTWNRRDEVLRTLGHLRALALAVPIVVVDNGSRDGTADAIAARYQEVTLVRLARNVGAAARNAGVEAADRPYVAFCDDDTWWRPGALQRAADILDLHPRLAAVTGRVLVGEDDREDPTCAHMAGSPFPNVLGVPGAEIFGFLAGACMMRREAYRAAGGFERRFLIGGEEALLAIDLMALGWHMAYVPDVAVCHHPSRIRDPAARRRLLLRNKLWCAWLRRPWRDAVRKSLEELRAGPRGLGRAGALAAALAGLPWVLPARRVAPAHVQEALAILDTFVARVEQAGTVTGGADVAPARLPASAAPMWPAEGLDSSTPPRLP
jgi:GT2 family glycosyltransferase